MTDIDNYTLTFPDGLKLRVEQTGDYPLLTPDYWDCECEQDYIHIATVSHCTVCGVRSEDGPDSHVSEVLDFVLFKQDD